jgi:toxin ParE1/3/4
VQTYSLTNEADNDLVNIFNYGIEHFGVELALQFYHDLNTTFDQIAAAPEHYQRCDELLPSYRRTVFKSYSIFFIVRDEFVEISRVLRKEDIVILLR